MLSEIPFEADGKQWRIIYSINALCVLEDALGMDTTAIYRRVNKPGPVPVKLLRTLFWGGLYDNHPEVTQEVAGLLMQSIGLSRAGAIVGKGMADALPVEDGTPDADPPRPGGAG